MLAINDLLAEAGSPPGWFHPISMVVGGLGLFLFGMNELSDGLKAMAGNRLRTLLFQLTRNRFVGTGIGAALTAIIQSSSATTVILIGFVEAQLLAWQQTLPVLLGANIGTTVTAQIIAFKVTRLALMMIGVGLVVMMIRRRSFMRHLGRALLALGMVFYGMHLMGQGVEPIKSNERLLSLLGGLNNPIWAIAASTILTAVIQASAATMGIIIMLASQGVIGLPAAIPLIFGANIGTCITAWLAGLGGSRQATRVALAHTLFKVCGVLLFVWWIPVFQEVVVKVSVAIGATGTARQVANAHTLFNLAVTAMFLPLTGVFAWIVGFVVREPPAGAAKLVARHLDDALLDTPQLAIDSALKQARDMGLAVHKMVTGCLDLFGPESEAARAEIKEIDDQVDFFENRLRRYLMGISQNDLDEGQAHELYVIYTASNELEHTGDTINRTILRLADKMQERGVRFTPEGWAEIQEFHAAVCDNLMLAVQAMTRRSDPLALETRSTKADLTAKAEELRRRHFARMQRHDRASIETDDLHMELLAALRHINANAGRIARAILSTPKQRSDHPPGSETEPC